MEQIAAFIVALIVAAGGGDASNVSPADFNCTTPRQTNGCVVEIDSPTGQELCGLYATYSDAGQCDDPRLDDPTGATIPGNGGNIWSRQP